uniref:Amidase domain-containing protein n=1 Tax=Moniliophthora roreri TaxID=221103 RepID=A0A0W0FPE1_MONRR
MAKNWEDIVAEKRAAQRASIPQAWLLEPDKLPPTHVLDVNHVPTQCGLFTPLELEITASPVENLLSNLSGGKWSSVEVTTAFCKRAAVAHQLVNCLTEIFFHEALKKAAELDTYYKRTGKTIGPLHGLPISFKDQINVKGVETTVGYVSRVGNVAKKNAILVDILLSLGAVPYVKTNVPQTIIWEETMNNLFGRTSSPFNRSFTSAGSSGGEGSLIGFRGSPLGIDTQSLVRSIRVPAAYAGLYGLRPSYGRLPFAGIDDALDGQNSIKTVAGPLTTSIEGVKILMKSVIQQQPWLKDPLAARKPWNEEEYKLTDRKGGERLCFAIMWNDEMTLPHPPVARALEMTKSALVKAGHRVIDWKPLKHVELSRCLGDILFSGIVDDVKADIELSGEPLIEHMALEDQTPERYRKLPTKSKSAYELWQAQKRQRTLREEYLQHWNETVSSTGTGRPVDAIIAPVSPFAGTPHGKNYVYDYTNAWNVLDYPALTIPVAKVDSRVDKKVPREKFFNSRDRKVYENYNPDVWSNAPIAVQLIGRTLEEEAVIAMGEIVDSALKSTVVHFKL